MTNDNNELEIIKKCNEKVVYMCNQSTQTPCNV